MKNIIKAQLYQLRHERLLAIMFFGITAAVIVNAVFGSGEGEILCGSETAVTLLEFQSVIAAMFVFMQTGVFCCSDFLDKTANYEIMSGHTRKEVYFGRVIPCIIAGIGGWLLIITVPYIVCSAISGWGTKLAFGEAGARVLLMLFPVARMICEFVMLSFMIRNQYVIMGIGYIVFALGGLTHAFSETGSVFLGITNLVLLSRFDSWLTFGLGSGAEHYVYESALSFADVFGTIAASVIFGAASLYMGFRFFVTDDVN